MIKPEQLTAYDSASNEIERATQILEAINVVRLDVDDRMRLANLIKEARNLKALFYSAAHQRFIHDRKGT